MVGETAAAQAQMSAQSGEAHPIERIVVIRPGALGDTLLTFPALAALRRRWPTATLHFIGRSDALELAVASGLADVGAAYDAPEWGALFASDPLMMAPASLRALLAGAACVAWLQDEGGGVARALATLGARPLVVARGQPARGEQRHCAVLLLDGLRALGLATPQTFEEALSVTPHLRTAAGAEREAAEVWGALGLAQAERVVALHPGSGGAEKRWPPERFAALALLLREQGWRALLLAGPQDGASVGQTREALGADAEAVAVAQGLGVSAVAALLTRCAAFVGNDAGVTHLAALLGAPTLALFGPTEPTQWRPLGAQARVVRGPAQTMASLSVAAVVEAFAGLPRVRG